ncbi:MAG: cobalamin biosynthesis protein [Dehalococcoidales bacterium]|jgi:adenosylcobinamide-phosphate synthase
MDALAIFGLALLVDLILGDPPNAFHPVAWMGRLISLLEKPGARGRPWFQFIYGIFITVLVAALFGTAVYFLLAYLEGISYVAYIAVGAVLLKMTFSFTGLRRTAHRIKKLLQDDKIDGARFELRSLVSRDTSKLPEPLLASAVVESVAESTCDSFVAPLFYYILFGVPGALAFRAVSTFDSMIGYHGRYEYLGKFPSRLDDVLNYIPARLTALLIVLAAAISRGSAGKAWRVATKDHGRTESPNAGWPMAAAAGALDVQMEKVGHYKLGAKNKPMTLDTIDASVRLSGVAAIGFVLMSAGVIYLAY